MCTKNKRKKKFDPIVWLVNVVEVHFRGILAGAIIFVVVIPAIIWLICLLWPNCAACHIFTADGLLAYIGAIFSGFMSMLVAAVALAQSKRAADAEAKRAVEARRNEVRPVLLVDIKGISDGVFDLIITNCGSHPILYVYLFIYSCVPCVQAGESIRRRFSTGECSSEILAIDKSHFDINSAGLPDKIWLYFEDVDHNFWQQDFTYTPDGYQAEGIESA